MPRPPTIAGSIRLKVPTSAVSGDVFKGWIYLTLTEPIQSTGPVSCDIVGLAHVGWNLDPNHPSSYAFAPSETGLPRAEGETEFWRQRVDLAPPQNFNAGEHAYEIVFPLPIGMTPSFFHTDPFTGETLGIRYVIEGSLQGLEEDPFRISGAISPSITLTSPPLPSTILSQMHSAQTANRTAVKLHCRRDRWRPGQEFTATVFATCRNMSTHRPVRILAVEVIQRTGLWTFAPTPYIDPSTPISPPTPLSRDYTRVVARVDLPSVAAGESHYSACKVTLPDGLPPTISVRGMEVMYEVSVVAVIGGEEGGAPVHAGGVASGGGMEVRCSSEVIVVPPSQGIEVPGEGWDDVDEEAVMTQQVVEAAVAQVKKMAIETQVEYEGRVKEAEELALKAMMDAEMRVKEKEAEAETMVRLKEEEADERVRLKEEEKERVLKERERLLKEKEKEKEKVELKLKETEEEAERRERAAKEAAAAAAAAVEAAKKANLAAFSKHPVLPATSGLSGISGKILGSTGLISNKASPVQMDASVKDSAFYQLFKLFYFDVTRDKIADLEKDGLVPGVVVLANAGAAVRVSRNAVPSFSSFDLKEESRSKAGQSQEEYATRLTLGAGRYYIAVYGNANPLVMTQFTLMIRKMPISLTLASFASLWRAVLSASTIPVDALQCGKDLDGKPLYAARVRMPDGSIRLGHVGRHLKGAVVVGGNGKALQVASGFEVLIQTPGLRFVEQLQEGVPPNAVPGGCEIDGRVLCVARATVHGKSVNMLSKMVTPGEVGTHLKGARVIVKGGLGILVSPFEVETGVVPFEVLVYQTANSGANPFMLPQQTTTTTTASPPLPRRA